MYWKSGGWIWVAGLLLSMHAVAESTLWQPAIAVTNKINAEYRVAKNKCYLLSGFAQDRCIAQAKFARSKAIGQAKTGLKTAATVPLHDAANKGYRNTIV